MQRPVNSGVKTREEHAQHAIRSRVLAQHMPHTCTLHVSLSHFSHRDQEQGPH